MLPQFSGLGGFPWFYENADQLFNGATLDYLSVCVRPGDAAGLVSLSPAGAFPNAWGPLLSSLTYALGAADRVDPSPQLRQTVTDNLRLVGRLCSATLHPTADNGGILTVNPRTGCKATAYQVGYGVQTPLATIQTALQDATQVLSVTVRGTTSTLRIDYPGYTLVAVSPTAWQAATGIGWFSPDPVAEAFANLGEDVTGFRFTSPPAVTPGPPSSGGTLGWLTGLLISAPPVTTTVPRVTTTPSAEVTVAGDPLAGLELLHLPPPADPDQVAAAELRPTAAGPTPTVPTLLQQAYVVGVVVGCLADPDG